MPHKDRAAYLAYLRRHHAEHRPAPVPQAQANPALPPVGTLTFDDDGERVQCHACGRWYGSLVTHIRTHGLDAASYKARFGLARTASLLSPATADRQRQRAIERGQGEVGRANLPEPGTATRPKGLPNRLQSRVRSSLGHRAGETGE